MDSNKLFLGVYDHPDTVLEAAKNLITSGYDIKDVYTPFAVHGLDRVMGVKRTRLSVAAFVFSMIGVASALTLMIYTSVFDWQMNVGGKPSFHVPTYIPITFELGILFTAFGMVASFFIVNRMFWGRETNIIDIRVTDDTFVIAVNVYEKTDIKALEKSLILNGAIEVKETIYEI